MSNLSDVYIPRPPPVDSDLCSLGKPLFTRKRMDEWLEAQQIELTSVTRLIVDIDPTGYVIGPVVEVERHVLNDDGKPFPRRDEEGEPIVNENGHLIMSVYCTTMRMYDGWATKES